MASPMALTRFLPIILLLVAMTATSGASEDRANFVKCYPPPTPTPDGGSAFRGNLLCLLEALPSAAAVTGFASLQTPGTGRAASDRAFVRGLCSDDSAPEPCRRCLTDAGKKMAEQCGDASRRAVFCDESCFVVYADDANFSASADEDFGAVYFTGDAVPSPDIVSVHRLVALAQSLVQRAAKNYGSVVTAVATTPASKGDATTGNRTVRVLAKCHGAPDCARCLREASLAMARSWEAGGGAKGRVSMVLGSNCYLLFEISPALTLGETIWTFSAAALKGMFEGFLIGMVVGVLILMVLCALLEVYDRMKARNNRNAPAVAPAVEAMTTKYASGVLVVCINLARKVLG